MFQALIFLALLHAESAGAHEAPDKVCLSDGQHFHGKRVEQTLEYTVFGVGTGEVRASSAALNLGCAADDTNPWVISTGLRTIQLEGDQTLYAIPQAYGARYGLQLLDGEVLYASKGVVLELLPPPDPEAVPELAEYHWAAQYLMEDAQEQYDRYRAANALGTMVGLVVGAVFLVPIVGVVALIVSYRASGCCMAPQPYLAEVPPTPAGHTLRF